MMRLALHSTGARVLLGAALLTFPGGVSPQTYSEVIAQTGISEGLCVHVGCGDGQLTAQLAGGGTVLVQGLALDAATCLAARNHASNQGLYGIVSIDQIVSATALPFTDNLINLLVADLDALGAKGPSEDEILRVLVPRGAAYVKSGGAWKTVRKPDVAGADGWTHWKYTAEGNPVSHDVLTGPPTRLKWTTDYSSTSGNNRGFRVSDGVTVYNGFWHKGGNRYEGVGYWMGRDSYNGVPLWYEREDQPWVTDADYVIVGDKVVVPPDKAGPFEVREARTGKLVLALSAGGRWPSDYDLLHSAGVLYEAVFDTIYALDLATGSLKWKYCYNTGDHLNTPVIVPSAGRLYAAVANGKRNGSRWQGSRCKALIGLDLSTGSKVWECTDFVGQGGGVVQYPNVQMLIHYEGKLVVFGPNGIGALDDPYLGMVDIAQSKTVWKHHYHLQTGDSHRWWGREPSYWDNTGAGEPHWQRWGFVACVKDGNPWVMNNGGAFEYDMATGAELRHFAPRTVNHRCNRPFVTDRYFILGMTMCVDDQGTSNFANVNRSVCARGSTPANGMLYYSPSTCGCFTQLRGFNAFAPGNPVAPVDDATRLVPGSALQKKAVQGVIARASVLPVPRGLAKAAYGIAPTAYYREPRFTGNPIRNDWYNNDYVAPESTEVLLSGSRTYVGIIHQHRLEAIEGGSVVWRFVAGGRISNPPVVYEGKVLFGAHDGYVYCLRESDGALVWKFLAAPIDRRVVAYGQVESASPVFNVVMIDGKVCFTAGRHPEVDGGIHAYGLDPATGALQWKGAIVDQMPWVAADSREMSGRKNTILNSPATVVDGKLQIRGALIDPASPPDGKVSGKAGGVGLRPAKARAWRNGGMLHVDLGATEDDVVVRIVDVAGRIVAQVRTGRARGVSLAIDCLANGLYTAQIATAKGQIRKHTMLVAR